MKVLVTGITGFVGRYLEHELEAEGYEVIGISRYAHNKYIQADIMDSDRIHEVITTEKPEYIVHLAGQSKVHDSWACPELTMELNCLSSIKIAESVRKSGLRTRILYIGSSEQYGIVEKDKRSISETHQTKPMNPYALSKQTQEDMMLMIAHKEDMDIVCTRSFNQMGPGQRIGMVIPDFCSGIARIEKGVAPDNTLSVGDINIERDFIDVRDAVKAYVALLRYGEKGEVYNVGSGTAYSLHAVLQTLLGMSNSNISVSTAKKKIRAIDVPYICCDNSKIRKDCNWNPSITLENSLRDVLEFWRSEYDKENRK